MADRAEELVKAALEYLARGWSVVPGHTVTEVGCSCRQADCDRPGKHPMVKWAEFQTELPSPNTVRYWWKRWPDANVIIITGAKSGIVAIDVDPRHQGDESWKVWAASHALPPTPISITGSGGQHIVFKHPGSEIRNTVDLLPGVDFRGDGGYILAPPSMHASGREYAWDTEFHPEDVPLADMTPELKLLVMRKGISGGQSGDGVRRSELDIEGMMSGRVRIAEGERNVEMTRVAGYFARSGMDHADLLGVVGMINDKACSPVVEDRELRRIVDSIYKRENAKTVQVEEAEQALNEADADPVSIAASIWRLIGVDKVTDWYQLQGDRLEYVLVTPEDELRFIDLLDYEEIRHLLLNHLGVLAPPLDKKASFDKRAQVLRMAARLIVVEPRKAEERVQEWVDAYARKTNAREITEPAEIEPALTSGPIRHNGELLLRPNRLALFIETEFGERMTVPDLRRMLKRAGWGEVGTLRAWHKAGPTEREKEAAAVAAS